MQEGTDRFGFDETTNYVGGFLGRLVPQALARRAVDVRVETDRDRYAVGEPVELTITFRNRLPVPITLETPTRRLWGWSVDGERAASDERGHVADVGSALRFRPGERRTIRRTWDGRFKRTGEQTRWEDPAPGEHEVAAFVALDRERRPADRTTIVIE